MDIIDNTQDVLDTKDFRKELFWMNITITVLDVMAVVAMIIVVFASRFLLECWLRRKKHQKILKLLSTWGCSGWGNVSIPHNCLWAVAYYLDEDGHLKNLPVLSFEGKFCRKIYPPIWLVYVFPNFEHESYFICSKNPYVGKYSVECSENKKGYFTKARIVTSRKEFVTIGLMSDEEPNNLFFKIVDFVETDHLNLPLPKKI